MLTASQLADSHARILTAATDLASFARRGCTPPGNLATYTGTRRGQVRAMYFRAATRATQDLLELLGLLADEATKDGLT